MLQHKVRLFQATCFGVLGNDAVSACLVQELLQALLYPTLASEVTTAITFPVDEVHVLRRTG